MANNRIIRAFGALSICLSVLGSACLSPETLRPVVDQNTQNIERYVANVEALTEVLLKEAEFHGELQVQVVRNKLSVVLIELTNKWAGASAPSPAELVDPSKEPHKSLAKEVETAKKTLNVASDPETRSQIAIGIVEEMPLAADIAMDIPGFTISRVLGDAFKLQELNGQINNETNDGVHQALMAKRNALVDAYIPVRNELEVRDAYLLGIRDFARALADQGRIAGTHADTIAAYARSQPRSETLGTAVRDPNIRESILKIIRDRKGTEIAERVAGYLAKGDDVFSLIDGLSGK